VLITSSRRAEHSSVQTMRHVPVLPEYPETDEKGFAYCVNVTGVDQRTVMGYHSQVSAAGSQCLLPVAHGAD
jgi:hypothetical protein